MASNDWSDVSKSARPEGPRTGDGACPSETGSPPVTGYRLDQPTITDELDALRAENERLRGEVTRLDALIDEGLYAENERLRTTLEEIYAGGEVRMRAWQLALIAGKALGKSPYRSPDNDDEELLSTTDILDADLSLDGL